ncbi:MAG: FtsB family cell division protein [Bacteroidota bacterium]
MIKKIPPFFKNIYFLVFMAALLWFVFFDQNNLIQQFRLSREIKKLEAEKEYYIEEIKQDSLQMEKFKNDPTELERYAREKYLMKKENEDIYIIRD